ncbi:MAG: GNAT family N-acetyltransferase [Erysipelotrichaceae bacterium]|nr:GNAT family N-acetyltransferase [Erysipelotrichaceae bacterium]
MISLKRIDENNFIEAFNLKLAKGQENYVSHPIRSLAQAYVYYKQCTPFGIYEEKIMVGYVMVIYDYDVPEYDIWHLMIDEKYQGKGYSIKAMEKVLEYIKTKPFGDSNRVALTCHKDNKIALNLYEKLGFEYSGNEDEEVKEMIRYL